MKVDDLNQDSLRWLVSCDESGIHKADYYGFGSLWMKWERRGNFSAAFKDLQRKHGYYYEYKWQKANYIRAQNFRVELIDYFFDRPWLAFHCIVVKKMMSI
jgi:hypothetical protein